jgi:hypothetical protein
MTEFWETSFRDKQEMWGWEPADSAKSEFGNYGLTDAEEIKEPIKDLDDKPSQRFWYIICKKENG